MATYTVVPGDTLTLIGRKTGHTWQDIAKINGVPWPYTIFPGQVLRLPVTVSPTPVLTPRARDLLAITSFRRYNSQVCIIRVPLARFDVLIGVEPKLPAWTTLRKLALQHGADAGITMSYTDNKQGWPLGPTAVHGVGLSNYPHEGYHSLVLDDTSIRTPGEVYPTDWQASQSGRKSGPQYRDIVSGKPLLLRAGNIVPGLHTKGLAPRTAIGITAVKDQLLMIAIAGRGAYNSAGVTQAQVAQICREAGAANALGGDGGGVVDMVARTNSGTGIEHLLRQDPARRIVTGLLVRMK